MTLLKHFCFLIFLFAASVLHAQQPCADWLYLKGGTVLIGNVSHFQPEDSVVMQTYSGMDIRVPYYMVEKLKQKCPRKMRSRALEKSACSFRERGWYHATRAAVLTGLNEWDVALQHSSGYKFNHLVSVGMGVGVENLSYLQVPTIPTYPVFAELRGYLLRKRVTPFYAVGMGWAFTGADKDGAAHFRWWGITQENNWRGGWLAQAQVGYRYGNHLLVYAGFRLQKKRLDWEGVNIYGSDRFLHKRIEAGVGFLL
jgi:opacity protein-like surface antigen